MQTRRKGRNIEKVENLCRTATAQISCQHAGANQVALARFCRQVFSRPVPSRSSTTVCMKIVESPNACQTLPPSVMKLSASSAATGARAAPMVLHRFAGQERHGIKTQNTAFSAHA